MKSAYLSTNWNEPQACRVTAFSTSNGSSIGSCHFGFGNDCEWRQYITLFQINQKGADGTGDVNNTI